MRTIMVLRGLPGCGKSTFARELAKKEPDRWKRVNRDDLRSLFDDGRFSKENEEFVKAAQDKLVLMALGDGYDVILDNTHLVPMTVKKVHRLAEGFGDVKVIEKCFNVPISECLQRNSQREGRARVPDKVINDMARGAGLDRSKKLVDKEAYYPPRMGFTAVEQDESLPKAVMCDLDGTLAIIGDRSPYDASRCDEVDIPNWPVIECVKAMHAQGYEVIFMSGRDSKYKEPTIRFIEQHCRVPTNWGIKGRNPNAPDTLCIPYQLHMRGTGDMRKDSIVKQELFDAHVAGKYNVKFMLDDRNQVVDFWRSIGIPCFQVAPGNF